MHKACELGRGPNDLLSMHPSKPHDDPTRGPRGLSQNGTTVTYICPSLYPPIRSGAWCRTLSPRASPSRASATASRSWPPCRAHSPTSAAPPTQVGFHSFIKGADLRWPDFGGDCGQTVVMLGVIHPRAWAMPRWSVYMRYVAQGGDGGVCSPWCRVVIAVAAVKPSVVRAGGLFQDPNPISAAFVDQNLVTAAAWPGQSMPSEMEPSLESWQMVECLFTF
jgi:hypothetical protein